MSMDAARSVAHRLLVCTKVLPPTRGDFVKFFSDKAHVGNDKKWCMIDIKTYEIFDLDAKR